MADKIICNKSDLVNVANVIRTKLGVTNTYHVSDLSAAVESIPTGIELPTLINPGSASDLLSGKELIGQDGNVVTGTIPTKTSSELTSSGATVTVPAGYYASNASKSVSTATQATPSISVSSSGLITASATQNAGYVSSGTKSATQQLTIQDAKTVTPSTSNQTAVASGRYTTGVVTVKGDSNLIADNIKSGTSIFGVTGTYEGSGGSGGSGIETCTLTVTSDRMYFRTGGIIYATDGNGELLAITNNGTFTIMRKSIVVVTYSFETTFNGNYSQLQHQSQGSLAFVEGDTSVYCTGQ